MKIHLPKMRSVTATERVQQVLAALSLEKAWEIDIDEHKPTRSDAQNRYLWGVCYAELMKVLPGWQAEDIHDYMLGEHFGWETIEGMGRKRMRPLRRSSALNKQEFADFVAFIQQKAAEHGCYIPDAE
jgi:hypothetical protein